MDPLHLTEFASPRYFDKINQQRDAVNAQQPQGPVVEGPSAPQPPLPIQSESKFILPIRRAEVSEAGDVLLQPVEKRLEKEKKSGFINRLLHKSSTPSSESSTQRRSSVGDVPTQKSLPFDQLFLNLPNELKVQIIASLPLSDVLNLRLASRAWHHMITFNEVPIVRYHLEHHIPAYTTRLYPAPEHTTLNFHYLCGIWHRLHVAAKLSYLICDWITKEIFLRTTEAQRLEFAPQKERMRRRLVPALFTIFHFFETYRTLHLQYVKEHGHGVERQPYTLNPIEAQIMNMYDDQTLLRVHQVFPVVMASFCRRLRPPSYVGRVERTVRGYLKDKPADEVHVAILCLGGLRQAERIWEIKGYNTRIGAVDSWYSGVAQPKEPVEAQDKKRRGILGLKKKKSMWQVHDATTKSTTMDESGIQTGAAAEPAHITAHPLPSNPIFHTSLAAGMPMGPLTRDQYAQLLSDLPVLQKMWLATAEALILDRKIVERSTDIKRNAQVMLELIREEGMDEEDEWLYGRAAPESVRPPTEATDDDPFG